MKLVKLGDHISLVGGGTPSKEVDSYWNGDIPWASVKDFKSDYISSTVDTITEEGVKNSATRIIPAGTLLIATRMAVGKVVFPQMDVAINQDLKAITCNSSLYSKFLFYLLKSKSGYFDSVSSGATVQGIKINHILDIQIPLPPLDTQKKIAAILDAADAYRQKTKTLIDKYDQLAQSLFLDMFGDPVMNPKNWEKLEMKKLCSFKKESVIPENILSGTKYLGLECIEKETGNILDINVVTDGDLKSNKFAFDENYILYGKLRPYLNKVALPNFKGICSTDIIPIMPIKDKTNRRFICQIMRHKGFVSFAHERSSGANLPRISPSEIEKYPIINPPITLQNQFAERIHLIEAQKQQAQASLQKAEYLFNSLLQRAFKGELVS